METFHHSSVTPVTPSEPAQAVSDVIRPSGGKPTDVHASKFRSFSGPEVSVVESTDQRVKKRLRSKQLLYLARATVGEMAGNLGALSVEVSAITAGALAMIPAGHTRMASVCLSVGALTIYRRLTSGSRIGSNSVTHATEDARMHRVTNELCSQAGIKVPKISSSTQEAIGLVDRLFARDVLCYNPKATSNLTDRELKAVIAHELGHSNSLNSKLKLTTSLLSGLAFSSVICTGILKGAELGGAYFGHVGFATGMFTGAAMSLFSYCVLAEVMSAVRSRAQERKADFYGMALNNDLEAFESALNMLSFQPGSGTKKVSLLKVVFRSHPPVSDRIKALAEQFEK